VDRDNRESESEKVEESAGCEAWDAFPDLSQGDLDNFDNLMRRDTGRGDVCYAFKVRMQPADIQALKPSMNIF
jgi:hypothetical protein